MKYMYSVVLFFLTACSAPGWTSYPIDQHVSVQLPSKPYLINLESTGANKTLKYKNLAPYQVFAVADNRAKYRYTIVVNTDPMIAQVVTTAVRDSLYGQSISKTLPLFKSSRLLNKTTFRTPAGEGVEFAFSALSSTTGKREVIHTRVLLVNRKTYALGFVIDEQDSVASDMLCRRFFNSITVHP